MRYEISEVVKKDQVMELVFGNCSKPRDLLGRHFILLWKDKLSLPIIPMR